MQKRSITWRLLRMKNKLKWKISYISKSHSNINRQIIVKTPFLRWILKTKFLTFRRNFFREILRTKTMNHLYVILWAHNLLELKILISQKLANKMNPPLWLQPDVYLMIKSNYVKNLLLTKDWVQLKDNRQVLSFMVLCKSTKFLLFSNVFWSCLTFP